MNVIRTTTKNSGLRRAAAATLAALALAGGISACGGSDGHATAKNAAAGISALQAATRPAESHVPASARRATECIVALRVVAQAEAQAAAGNISIDRAALEAAKAECGR
jgi:hypothetical protein